MKSSKTSTAITIFKWPVFGALFAGGALGVAYLFGRKTAAELGGAGGVAFAEGMAKVQQQLATVSGERGRYR